MKTTTFSQLRNHAKKYFDEVEGGEEFEVYRHGKPIAVISPVRRLGTKHWRDFSALKVKGISLSKTILKERREKG